MVFCTLYDSNYLDKGLVMYRSLVECTHDFKLYVLAMDEKCEEILSAYNYPNQTIINLDGFSSQMGLEEVRRTRKRAEFCWTCTSFLIDYVLTCCGEKECTYVDSDLKFYSDPQCLVDEMKEKNVQIVEHRFDHSPTGQICKAESGTYCVQFNTFRNEDSSMKLLHWWEKKCYESCSNTESREKGVFGDQGYLETWGNKQNVSVLRNLGGGVAPWNVYQYVYQGENLHNKEIMLMTRRSKETFTLVFYHFHNIRYLSPHKAYICAYSYGNVDPEVVKNIYIPYLQELNAVKEELRSQFNFFPLLLHHPGIDQSEINFVKKLLRLFQKPFLCRVYDTTIGRIMRNKRMEKNIVAF